MRIKIQDSFVDDNDSYRVGQWTKDLDPTNIICAMRPGLVDDFYEFWRNGSDSYNSSLHAYW